MSALDKLMEGALARDTAAPSKPIGLVADPNISVDQIQKVFKEYLEYKKSVDAWSLIGSPWRAKRPQLEDPHSCPPAVQVYGPLICPT